MAPSSRPDPSAHYRIGMVARLSGVTTHTIRMWERRYGAVTPLRSEAGGRLYTEDDIERLKALKALVDEGHAIGRIAGLPMGELSSIGAAAGTGAGSGVRFEGTPVDGLDDVARAFLDAIAEVDVDKAQAVLEDAVERAPARQLIYELLLPVLQEVGRRWHVGEIRVVQEHAATHVFRNLLGTISMSTPAPENASVAVACTPPGQRHELGAMLAGIIAAIHGHRVVHFGADLPVPDIVHGVEKTGAELLLLSITVDDESSVGQLEELVRDLPDGVRIIVGGRGAPRGVAGVKLITDLEVLEAELRAHEPSGARPARDSA